MTPVDYETYTFLSEPTVFGLYAYIRELSSSNLRDALNLRGLSSLGDKKVLRMKLLYSLVLSRCPNARIPWSTTPEEIDGNEAARTWLLAEAVQDVHWMQREVDRKKMVMRETQTESLVAGNIETPTEKPNIETRLNYLKSLKLWGINFTGETGQPARTFLENLKDYRKFSRIDDLSLFEMLPCILDEKTRSWYHAKNFTSWDVFEPSFLNALVLLRDDDYPASPRLVSVAVGDSDFSTVDCSRDDSIDRNPDNPGPYRSSSDVLQALKRKISSIKRENDDYDESVVSESVFSDSSLFEYVVELNYHNARQDYNYARPNNYGQYTANDYAFLNSLHANSGKPQYDAVNMSSALCDEYDAIADRAVHEVAKPRRTGSTIRAMTD